MSFGELNSDTPVHRLTPVMETATRLLVDHLRPPRYTVKINALVTYPCTQGVGEIIGHGRNINSNGMQLSIPAYIEVGTPIRVQLSMPPSRELVALEATVRNRNHFNYGIAFVSLTHDERRKLTKYCAAMSLISAL